jgi:hypothetical protein
MLADAFGPDIPRSTGEYLAAPGGYRLAPDVHAWLDADRAGRAPRRADAAHDVDFWHRLEKDIARRRQVRTPIHVQRAVMAALPGGRGAAPWYRRPLSITPGLLALAGTAMLALGVAVGVALRAAVR